MPHGDFSDYTAYGHLACGIASLVKPELWYASLGPIGPLLDGTPNPDALRCAKAAGVLLVWIGWVMYVVRWSTVNGPFAAGPACLGNAALALFMANGMDGGIQKLRFWHVYAALAILGALHFMFNPNPKWTPATLKKHEEERRKRKAAKK